MAERLTWAFLPLEIRQEIITHFIQSIIQDLLHQKLSLRLVTSNDHLAKVTMHRLAAVSYSFGHDDCQSPLRDVFKKAEKDLRGHTFDEALGPACIAAFADSEDDNDRRKYEKYVGDFEVDQAIVSGHRTILDSIEITLRRLQEQPERRAGTRDPLRPWIMDAK